MSTADSLERQARKKVIKCNRRKTGFLLLICVMKKVMDNTEKSASNRSPREGIHAIACVNKGCVANNNTMTAEIFSLYFNALISKDMYLAGAFLVFLAIALLIGNLGADILLAWVDPRIRYE